MLELCLTNPTDLCTSHCASIVLVVGVRQRSLTKAGKKFFFFAGLADSTIIIQLLSTFLSSSLSSPPSNLHNISISLPLFSFDVPSFVAGVSVLLRFDLACTNPPLSQIPALLSRVGKLYRDENCRRASKPQFPLVSLCQHSTKLLVAVWCPTSSAVTSRQFSVVATAVVATGHCCLHLWLTRENTLITLHLPCGIQPSLQQPFQPVEFFGSWPQHFSRRKLQLLTVSVQAGDHSTLPCFLFSKGSL
jgi:hypothetical protein